MSMKTLCMITLMVMLSLPAWGQRLVIGERSPELKTNSWVTAAPSYNDRNVMVEFYHSSNKNSAERLAMLRSLAESSQKDLVVVVVTNESDPAVRNQLTDGNPMYHVVYDKDGDLFRSFCARYVPYAVIYDRHRRVLWVGNPSSLTDQDIVRIIK